MVSPALHFPPFTWQEPCDRWMARDHRCCTPPQKGGCSSSLAQVVLEHLLPISHIPSQLVKVRLEVHRALGFQWKWPACACWSNTSFHPLQYRCLRVNMTFQNKGLGEMPSARLDSHRDSVQNGMVEKFTAFMATIFVPNFRF